MSFTLGPKAKTTRPAIRRGKYLAVFVATRGFGASNQGVSEDAVGQAIISQHSVIGGESSCQRRVRNMSDATLGCPFNGTFCSVNRDLPTHRKGTCVHGLGTCRGYSAWPRQRLN